MIVLVVLGALVVHGLPPAAALWNYTHAVQVQKTKKGKTKK